MPQRKVLFLFAVRSPILPPEIRPNSGFAAKSRHDGEVSALILLRYIDYRRLRHKRSRRKHPMTVEEHFELGQAGTWRFVAALSFDEWRFSHRPSAFTKSRIRYLIEALESATRDR